MCDVTMCMHAGVIAYVRFVCVRACLYEWACECVFVSVYARVCVDIYLLRNTQARTLCSEKTE